MSGNIEFTYTEYIGDIQSSTAFTVTKYPINPGLSNVFPFLSQISNNFEQYFFKSLTFTYRSQSAVALNSTNTALGSILFAINYDVLGADFVSKFEMNNYAGTRSTMPASSMAMHVKKAAYPVLFVRGGTPPSDADLRLYDHANFYVASEGSQAVADVGEMWVTYTIVLLKPKLSDALGWDTSMAIWYNSTGIASATPLGTGNGLITAASLDVVSGSSTVLPTIPSGIGIYPDISTIKFNAKFGGCLFLISLYYGGTGAVVTFPAFVLVRASNHNLFRNYVTNNSRGPQTGNTSSSMYIEYAILLDAEIPVGSTASMVFTSVTPPGAPVIEVKVIMIPPFKRTNQFIP